MCPSGATCLPVDGCFSEQVLCKSNSCWSRTKRTSSSSHWKLTSRQEISTKVLNWRILCCQFLWIVHFWLPLQYYLTFIWWKENISYSVTTSSWTLFGRTTNYIIMEYIIQRVANNLCIQPKRLYINYLQLKCNVKKDNSNIQHMRYDQIISRLWMTTITH